MPQNKQPPGTVIVDTVAPFDFFSPLGYYQVGNKIFNHKIYALKEASQTGLIPKWFFNEQEFSTLKWTQSLGIDLPVMYAQRARQLREKYDHLILWWSGGADSTSMLQSFLHNNIVLDEIFVGWPLKLTQGKYQPSLDTKVANFVSEWDLTIKPGLQWLADHHPNIKISFVDTSDTVCRKHHDESLFSLTETFQYLNDQRVESIAPIIRQRSQGNRTVANILGITPPELVVVNDYLCVYFHDLTMSPFGKSEFVSDGVQRKYEFFYATPDMPELQREMCHAVLSYVKTTPRLIQLFDKYKIVEPGVHQLMWRSPHNQSRRRLLNKIIHPNYNHNNFQADKQSFVLLTSGWWDIFYKNSAATEFVDPHRYAVMSEMRMIDPKFLTFTKPNSTNIDDLKSFVSYTSKFYPVGKVLNQQ